MNNLGQGHVLIDRDIAVTVPLGTVRKVALSFDDPSADGIVCGLCVIIEPSRCQALFRTVALVEPAEVHAHTCGGVDVGWFARRLTTFVDVSDDLLDPDRCVDTLDALVADEHVQALMADALKTMARTLLRQATEAICLR